MKTPIPYYGGKTNMLRHILPLLPEGHCTFAEPFFGGGAVLFGKSPSKIEVINDNYELAVNFFRVCQNPKKYGEFLKLLRETLHSEADYRRAKAINNSPPHHYPDVLRAWAFWCGTNLAFAHKINSGFAFAKTQALPGTTANRIAEMTTAICERLQHVQIFCRDALDIIRRFDAPGTLFYLDPPYPNSNCGHYERGKEVYYALLDMLPSLSGKWLLSSYPTPELQALWTREGVHHAEFRQPLSVSGKLNAGRTKTETLTWNYEGSRDV